MAAHLEATACTGHPRGQASVTVITRMALQALRNRLAARCS